MFGLLVFPVFLFIGPGLTPPEVFVALAWIPLLQRDTQQLVDTINQLARGMHSLSIVQEFLEGDEPYRLIENSAGGSRNKKIFSGSQMQSNQDDEPSNLKPRMVMSALRMSTDPHKISSGLQDVSLCFYSNQLTLVTGPPGSGKSSFLQGLIGELPLTAGEVLTEGDMVYVDSNPWVFSGTIRDNILFGRVYNVVRYFKVLKACALEPLITRLSQGDLTRIGDGGVGLTVGHRIRINLARASYSNADIFLMNEPLRGLDPKVARCIFKQCIMGLLSTRARVLVSQQTQFSEYADHIVVFKEGRVSSEGSYEEMIESGDSYFREQEMEDQWLEGMEEDSGAPDAR